MLREFCLSMNGDQSGIGLPLSLLRCLRAAPFPGFNPTKTCYSPQVGGYAQNRILKALVAIFSSLCYFAAGNDFPKHNLDRRMD
jgi:hypothetical protein